MVENIGLPSVQPNSENEPSENIQVGVTNNNGGLVPTTAQTIPSSGGESSILPHELNEELTPPISKKPRGRPLGSKNRQKKPILVNEADNKPEIIILEISADTDIVESILNLAQQKNKSVTVLSGSGLVSDVTLLNQVSRVPALPIHGTFSIMCLEGTYINPNCECIPPQLVTNPSCSSFTIYLAGAEGNVFCGNIGGKVKAAGQVIVTAILSKKHRMNLINRNSDEVEEHDRRYVAGIISNHERVAFEQDNVNNSVVGVNPAPGTE